MGFNICYPNIILSVDSQAMGFFDQTICKRANKVTILVELH